MLILATPLLSRDLIRRRTNDQRGLALAHAARRSSVAQRVHSGGTTPFLKMKQP